jgi:hypothetical protein
VLIALHSVVLMTSLQKENFFYELINFAGDPVNAFFLGLFASFLLIKVATLFQGVVSMIVVYILSVVLL